MEELKKMVEELEEIITKSPEDDAGIRDKLQEICREFLLNYNLVFGNYKIEPVLVEAYFSLDQVPEEKKDMFLAYDSSIHAKKWKSGKMVSLAKKRQKKHYGKLYIHNVTSKDDGLDVCLSNKDTYYLSLLIKNAFVTLEGKKEFATQRKVSQLICEKCQQCDDILNCIYNDTVVLEKHLTPKEKEVLFLPRKGLSGKFKNEELAVISMSSIRDSICDDQYKNLTLPEGCGKQWRCAIVAIDSCKTREEAFEEARRLNCSKVQEKYFECAKDFLDAQRKLSDL